MTDLRAQVIAIVAASKVFDDDADKLGYIVDNLTDVVRAQKSSAWGEGVKAHAEYERLYAMWMSAGLPGTRPEFPSSPYAVMMPDDAAGPDRRCPECRQPFGHHEEGCIGSPYGRGDDVV